jgi:hypothetical protein
MESKERTKKWRKKKIISGLCPSCGQEKTSGKRCIKCLKNAKLDNQRRRKERFEQGLCVNCGKNPHKENMKRCQECCDKHLQWYKQSEYVEKNRGLDKKRRQDRKLRIINHYGGKCICCGEKELIFLCLDHIDGGGNEHRRQIGNAKNRCGSSSTNFYRWIEKNNYPDILQLLCHNCNAAKEINNGICPHQQKILLTENVQ